MILGGCFQDAPWAQEPGGVWKRRLFGYLGGAWPQSLLCKWALFPHL